MPPSTSKVSRIRQNPASPASRSSTLYYDLDAISSGDSVSGDSALRSSPVSMVDQELAVISVHSSDSDHDLLDELFQFRSLNGPLSPVPDCVSLSVVESPSHYPALAEPVVLSTISFAHISPNLVREVGSSGTLDVYPFYEVSPDTMCDIPPPLPVTPPFSEGDRRARSLYL